MSDKKIKVPEGMLKAAVAAMKDPPGSKFRSTEQWASLGLEAALRWLAEQVDERNQEYAKDIRAAELERFGDDNGRMMEKVAYEFGASHGLGFVRRMFLAPEPEAPAEIANLLVDSCAHVTVDSDYINDRVREAYRRGYSKGCEDESEHRDPRYDTSSN
jgi:hypothetical protein